MALTYVIVTDLVSLRERGKWFSCISLTWTIGSIMGPLVGGALVEKSWPWLFWINLPFCALGFVVIPLTLRIRRKDDDAATAAKLREFDWIGSLLFVGSLTSVLVPLSWGGVMYDWSSPRTAAPLVVGFVGLVAFGFHIMNSSRYSRCDPLIRPTLFTSLTSITGYCITVVHGIIAWCLLYYVPMYQEVRGASPLDAGIALLPFTATVAPGAIVVGLLVTKTGLYRPYLWGGWFFVPIGLGLLMLLDEHTPTWKWIVVYLTGGIGLGGLYSAQAFVCQAGASNADVPFAAALYAFSRNLGQAIGVAVGGVTFQNRFQQRLRENPEFADKASEWSKNASALVEVIRELPASMDAMKEAIVDGYMESLRTVWLVLCVLASVALVAAVVLVKHKSLDREFETEHGLVEAKSGKEDEKTSEGQV